MLGNTYHYRKKIGNREHVDKVRNNINKKLFIHKYQAYYYYTIDNAFPPYTHIISYIHRISLIFYKQEDERKDCN